jgi:hypothetical protein
MDLNRSNIRPSKAQVIPHEHQCNFSLFDPIDRNLFIELPFETDWTLYSPEEMVASAWIDQKIRFLGVHGQSPTVDFKQ